MSEVIVRVGETDDAVIKIDDQNTIKGADGKDGQDGFSPIVDVEEIEGGHRVTITDAVGDHVFDVMDGSGGGSPADGVYVTDSQGNSWYIPKGEGEDAPVILDENGDAWHLLPGIGGEDDIDVTDGNGNDWHFARAEDSGGLLPPGGTDGQYLVKDSTAEGGARWVDLPIFEPTAGAWSVTPLVEAETTLHTAGNYLDRDIVVEAIPYAEVSNISGGMTATIGG
jgi:hypothetical protein